MNRWIRIDSERLEVESEKATPSSLGVAHSSASLGQFTAPASDTVEGSGRSTPETICQQFKDLIRDVRVIYLVFVDGHACLAST